MAKPLRRALHLEAVTNKNATSKTPLFNREFTRRRGILVRKSDNAANCL
ncbi:hypothetical protein B4110_3578 [Parageobacillus toebii]|uniref:Uncharacterized protein n=1 Tax=Parageobacillus toebii TaxID=153151 RepID=A0A150N7T8_9BACL|nr:hypothetical protein B4110_3578 [Parageobacillus toebii]